MRDEDAVIRTIQGWSQDGLAVALATIVDTWGSAPRPTGSLMAVDQDGRMVGSVSGGCVEAMIVEEALLCIQDGRPRLLDYGISDDMAWAVGLACGGRLSVYLERIDR